MWSMIDQMPGPDNRDDRQSPSTQSEREPENVSGSYYYDDTTGYEVYEEDDEDESAGDDSNRNRDEDKLTTEDTEEAKTF